MEIFNRIKRNLKEQGLKGTIRKKILKMLEIDRQQEEIDTLYYFFNNMTDITKLKPTKDSELRALQICAAALLQIFHIMCKKYHLTYWLDYGTLLGAVRHGGFIPWDDDIDVAMPREDYDKVIPLMKEEMEKYGIVVRWGGYFDDRGYMARLAFAYKTIQTGIWIDIFPIDHCNAQSNAKKIVPLLKRDIKIYQNYYKKRENRESLKIICEKKNEIFANVNTGSNPISFHGPEFLLSYYIILDDKDIYPIKTMNFEGYKLNIPANYDIYLRCIYGNNYMEYPHSGVEHHTDPDGELAKTRARRHGVDMQEVLKYLIEVSTHLSAVN